MKTLKMYGTSDNLIESEGIDGCDEFNVGYHGGVRSVFDLRLDDEAIRIHAVYGGSWGFAITSENDRDDYRSIPDWPIRRSFGRDCEYSETIEIDVPNDAVLQRVK